MTGEKLSSIYYFITELVYWSVRSSTKSGIDEVKNGRLFQLNLLMNMKIWCEIQVILYLSILKIDRQTNYEMLYIVFKGKNEHLTFS